MDEIEQLKALAKDNEGWCFRWYSGRGMFGAECASIYCDRAMPVIEAAVALGVTGARTDSMGRGAVVYWPSIKRPAGAPE